LLNESNYLDLYNTLFSNPMKFHLLPLLALPLFSSAQTNLDSMNRWSIGASFGVHDGMAPTAGYTKIYQIEHFGINGRYMITNRVGIRLGMSYDFMDFIDKPYNTYYVRTSLEGVVNAGDILHLPQVMPRVGLLVHGGFGISHMWSNNNPIYPNSDPFFDRSDEMLNFVFGATPQFKINDRISLNADLSFIFHAHQTNRFDMQAKSTHGAIDGYMLNASIGASYYFGKNKTHADWTPTKYSEGVDELKTRIQALEDQAKDDDKDGVPNSIDTENDTPEGSLVDSKGVSVKDQDKDGIADAYDACPDVAGPFSTNGCVDSDRDGVADKDDDCPQIAGIASSKGCPPVDRVHQTVMVKAPQDIQFDYRVNELIGTSYPGLDEAVKVMMDNPDYRLEIAGHTDNTGEASDNVLLSKLRAQNVANYLISKGVPASRIDVVGYGESQPKVSNETPEGQAINRRVEFHIIFE